MAEINFIHVLSFLINIRFSVMVVAFIVVVVVAAVVFVVVLNISSCREQR